MRITRPDATPRRLRYEDVATTIKEAVCAAYATLNGIGVPIYSMACYEGITENRTLRYGSVHMMQRADMDLFRALEADTSREFAHEAALKVTELLYRTARCGVAFFDIKPANILCCIANGSVEFFLTDFDPMFFVRLPSEYDWHSLMLLNLALLSAHVRNMDTGTDNEGIFEWGRTVAPVLCQLVTFRSQYNSEWLFHARAARIDTRSTTTPPRSTYLLVHDVHLVPLRRAAERGVEAAPGAVGRVAVGPQRGARRHAAHRGVQAVAQVVAAAVGGQLQAAHRAASVVRHVGAVVKYTCS